MSPGLGSFIRHFPSSVAKPDGVDGPAATQRRVNASSAKAVVHQTSAQPGKSAAHDDDASPVIALMAAAFVVVQLAVANMTSEPLLPLHVFTAVLA